MSKKITITALALAAVALTGCQSDADKGRQLAESAVS